MSEGCKSVCVVYVLKTEESVQLRARGVCHEPVVTGRGGKEKDVLCLCDL